MLRHIATAGSIDNGHRHPGSNSVTYSISLFFTTATATVVGIDRTSVTVGPGKTVSWGEFSKIPNASNLLCVLRGVG
jgi:hypothetical protein